MVRVETREKGRSIIELRSLLKRTATSDLSRHGAMVLFATVAVSVANFLFYSLAGRVVDVAGYGELMSLVSLVLIATAPAMVAQNTLAKLTADLVAAGDRAVVASLARTVFRYAVGVAAGVFIIALVLRESIAALVHVSDPTLVPLAALAAAALFVIPIQRGVLQGANRFGDLAVSMLVEALTRSVAVVPLARAAGARGGLLALAISTLLPLVVGAIRSSAIWPAGDLAARTMDLRRLSQAAILTGSGFLAVTTMLYFDVVLVRHYFDPFNAGLYSALAVVGRAIFSGVAFIPVVIIPKIVQRRANRASVRPVAVAGIGMTVCAALIGVGIVGLAPQRVIALVSGKAYVGAAPFLLPYAIAISILAGANVAAAVRVGMHRFGHVVPLALVAVAEIVAVALRHATIADVLWIIVAGHSAALLVTILARVLDPTPMPDKDISVPLTVSLTKN